MANEIFISYSRKDFDKVRQIKESIDKELGIDFWMDLDGIESGDQFKEVIISAILRHDIVLFMMTANSMNSPWALKELNFAEKKKKRIVLVDIDHSPMTDAFMFDYGDKDIIDWDNKIQHDKLIKNLRSWIKQTPFPQDINHEEDEENKIVDKGTFAFGDPNKFLADYALTRAKAAEQGLAIAQYNLGCAYDNGEGVHQSNSEAFKWYLKAAEQGMVEAQFNVANLYNTGEGVHQSKSEAFKWYLKAAEQGLAIAQYNLGCAYDNGEGVHQSKSEAFKWYELAARNGNVLAIDKVKETKKR